MYYTQNNFNGGVVSPWMDSRGDVQRFKSSLRKCENFICMPYGGLRRRMGSEFVSLAGGQNRLIGYQRTSTEGYVLELGENYLRVHSNGARIDGVDLPTPWSASEAFEIQYVKINNILFMTHKNHPPQQLRFLSQNSWALTPMDFDYPAFADYTFDSEVSVSPDNTVTSTSSIGFASPQSSTAGTSGTVSVSGAWTVDISSVAFTPATPPDPAPTSYFRLENSVDGGNTWSVLQNFTTAGNYTGTAVSGLLRFATLEVSVSANLESSNDVEALSVGDSVVIDSTLGIFEAGHVGSEFLVSHTPDETEVRLSMESSGTSDLITIQGEWNLFTSGNWSGNIYLEQSTDNGATFENVITRSGDSDRNIATNGEVSEKVLMRVRYEKLDDSENSPYITLESDGTDIDGRVLITGFNSANQVIGTVVAGVYSSDSTDLWRLAAWSDVSGYPAAITWHEGRLWFGGSKFDESRLWASASDDFFNFEYGTDDDDGFTRLIGTTELSDIVWLSSQGSLFIGTSGEEWRGRSYSDSGVITPSSLVLRRVSNSGSEPVSVVFAGSTLMHVQREGRSIVQIGYSAASASEDGFTPGDLNQLAPHVSRGGIKTTAFQAIRDGIVWGTTGLGKLIGLTFDKAQNVQGWHEHTTAGTFESVATVYEQGDEDSVYVSVLRNGIYMIERMKVDQYDIIENQAQENGLYMDSAVSYVGTAVSSLSGLDHLEGLIVQVMNGSTFEGEKTVIGGSITLDNPGTNISAGLPYVALFETLPIVIGADDGSTDSRKKRVASVNLRVYKSVTAEVAMNSSGAHLWGKVKDNFRKIVDPDAEEIGGSQGLLEDWKIPLASSHDTDARVAVRVEDPHSLNILSVTTQFDFAG